MSRRDFETTRTLDRRLSRNPRSDERPYLLAISGEHAGRFFALSGVRDLVIGRIKGCDVRVLHDKNISRRHARLVVSEDGRIRVEDLASTNGTLVNGREVDSAALKRGDRLFLGLSTIFKFDYLSDEERARWESATFDALTECHNRAFFDARLAELSTHAEHDEQHLSLILLDVDHFKGINDVHGHQAGDYALQRVALVIQAERERTGLEGFACRYGGEEFALLLPGIETSRAIEIAEGIRKMVSTLDLEFEDQSFKLTLSAGIACSSPTERRSTGELVRLADEALYRAKNAGRNRVES